ncbi:50S ribosomal protein L17 [Patescibacteria group bacterium]|nr:50S ribosomal protein L17 [Patescibacteria group bacterium]
MHRHSNIGKKFSRAAAPRRALMRGLVDSLILYERIETTEIKAKELARIFDKLVTKAKKQDLHNYRQIMSTTINPIAAEKLNTDLVNGFQGRDSGYTRVIKTGKRLGDGAEMAVIELILDADYKPKAPQVAAKKSTKKKSEPKKAAVKPTVKAKAAAIASSKGATK